MRLLTLLLTLLFSLAFTSDALAAEKSHSLRMSLSDTFTVSETAKWSVVVDRELMLRFADVAVRPKEGKGFSLMLYFKCDTPDLAQFDTLEKMQRSIRTSSQKYLPHAVEKTVELKPIENTPRFGCYTILTDASVAAAKSIPPGEFKYIIRGMVRLSADSALGFSLMINELNGPLYDEVFSFILSFVKTEGAAEKAE